MRSLTASVAVGLALCAALPARAQEMYRWLDAQGRVHFGSEPPADARGIESWSPDGDRLRIDARAAGEPAPRGSAPARPVAPRRLAPGTPPAAPAPDERIGGRTESEWRHQAHSLEQRIEQLEREPEALEETTQAYGGWGTRRDSQGLVTRTAVPERRPALERALEKAESELDAFEEEARAAGVPPGWMR
jgi:hypothetical protein